MKTFYQICPKKLTLIMSVVQTLSLVFREILVYCFKDILIYLSLGREKLFRIPGLKLLSEFWTTIA